MPGVGEGGQREQAKEPNRELLITPQMQVYPHLAPVFWCPLPASHQSPCSLPRLSASQPSLTLWPPGLWLSSEWPQWLSIEPLIALFPAFLTSFRIYQFSLSVFFEGSHGHVGASLVTQSDKQYACQAGDMDSIPDREYPLEKEMAPQSSILAWRILRAEEPGGLQSTL